MIDPRMMALIRGANGGQGGLPLLQFRGGQVPPSVPVYNAGVGRTLQGGVDPARAMQVREELQRRAQMEALRQQNIARAEQHLANNPQYRLHRRIMEMRRAQEMAPYAQRRAAYESRMPVMAAQEQAPNQDAGQGVMPQQAPAPQPEMIGRLTREQYEQMQALMNNRPDFLTGESGPTQYGDMQRQAMASNVGGLPRGSLGRSAGYYSAANAGERFARNRHGREARRRRLERYQKMLANRLALRRKMRSA